MSARLQKCSTASLQPPELLSGIWRSFFLLELIDQASIDQSRESGRYLSTKSYWVELGVERSKNLNLLAPPPNS